MNGAFDVKTLGQVIARALGLKPGDDIEIQRDRLDPNRVLVRRHVNQQGSSA
jgi:bifunctional DNA-binding transcriptional regulator/antitoxin component of YhaV-PrlF toxin-antitoxin module